jgi:hypothetical protein
MPEGPHLKPGHLAHTPALPMAQAPETLEFLARHAVAPTLRWRPPGTVMSVRATESHLSGRWERLNGAKWGLWWFGVNVDLTRKERRR